MGEVKEYCKSECTGGGGYIQGGTVGGYSGRGVQLAVL